MSLGVMRDDIEKCRQITDDESYETEYHFGIVDLFQIENKATGHVSEPYDESVEHE